MTDNTDVFLSYSHNDLDAAALLHTQLESAGLSVFRDEEGIRWSDQWLDRLQEAVSTCKSFVVLVGRDGVRRWIGAETQVALKRYFGPHDDTERLPIYPILLGETKTDTLPAFLQLFQATPWNGDQSLPDGLIEQIRGKMIVTNESIRVDRRPFLGLRSFGPEDTQMFFGRQEETLDALGFFNTRKEPVVRWLEINGNSGCGKSSLMNAGLLPLVEKGWLWRRTGYEHWTCIGPMMPGKAPVEMLAECLAKAFDGKMGELVAELKGSDDALRYWLRERKAADTAFLLAVDQFEELFNFADRDERGRFDRLLAAALEDADCPMFVISTVRADFLDRFDDLPRLVSARNRIGKPWTLAPIGPDGLRELIEEPARLAGLDVSEVKGLILDQAKNEPGALPLVEHALEWLWNNRSANRLSERRFHEAGGLAGILSHAADELLATLDTEGRTRALELLFRLVKVDPEGVRHARQPLSMADAEKVAGAGKPDRDMIERLAGRQVKGLTSGPVRLITITEEGQWVNLIHETLIRSKGLDAEGKPQPYWPTLWRYIEQHKERAAWQERLQLLAREWKERTGLSRLSGLAGWSSLFGFRGLAALGSLEQRYLRWSRARAGVEIALLATVLATVGHGMYWAKAHEQPYQALETYWLYKLGIKELPLPAFGREIPAGSFQMGSDGFPNEQPVHPHEQPVHRVTFTRPFLIGTTEVTFAQYDAFCDATGRAKANDRGWGEDQWGRDDRSVFNVDWNDARAYAQWLDAMTGWGCQLPSEAEWEYAARAGTTAAYALPAPDGSDDIVGEGLANCDGCGGEWDERHRTAPVASFPPNAWGFHDMHGNVREWVEDCWHNSYKDAPEDGGAWFEENGGDCGLRVLRGGSWGYDPGRARSADRLRNVPSIRSHDVGFRVVCSAPSLGADR